MIQHAWPPFRSIIDWIMKKSTAENNIGIPWNFTTNLKEQAYADIALLSRSKEQIKRKRNGVSKRVHTTGISVNAAKTNVMRFNPTNPLQAQKKQVLKEP